MTLLPFNGSKRAEHSSTEPRVGCKDIWNSWMLDEGSEWDVGDIPFCPCTAKAAPEKLCSYSEAVSNHKKLMAKEGSDYQVDAFLHGWEDDYKYDGRKNSIWLFLKALSRR